MNEIWKQYKDTQYEVSTFGNVRRIGAKQNRKIQDNGRGYKNLILRIDGQSIMVYLHRMVAETFIPNPNNLPQVNHIDQNKANNHFSNLEWITAQDNLAYGDRTLRQAQTQGKIVVCIETGEEFYSTREASRQLGIPQCGIQRCCVGKQNSTHNLHFKYKEEVNNDRISL